MRRAVRHPGWAALLVVLAAAAIILPLLVSSFTLRVMIQALFFAYLAQCWNIAGGYAGQFSLGHPVFLAAGGYTSTLLLLHAGITPWAGMLIGAALAAALAAVVASVTARYRVSGIYFALFTMALWTVTQSLVSTWGLAGRENGLLLPLGGGAGDFLFSGQIPYYYVILALVLLVAGVTWALARSRMGRAFIALREDPLAAEAAGVLTARARIQAMAISGFLIALGGTFYAQYFRFISPQTVLGFDPTLQMLLGTMIGGAGTIVGPIAGGIGFNLLGEALREVPFLAGGTKGSVFTTGVFALILIATILYLPGGLVDLVKRGRGAFRRRRPAAAAVTTAAETADFAPPAAATVAVGDGDRADRAVPHAVRYASSLDAAADEPLVKAERLRKVIGGLAAVDGVSLTVSPGEVLGIIGPNGAGKTTLLNCLSGFMRPTDGSIAFAGREAGRAAPSQLCKWGMARTFQITKPFPALTALETVAIAAHNRIRDGREAQLEAQRVLEFVRFRAPHDTLGRDLSVVNRKRLELARALATQPRLLLLDEICAGLNSSEVRQVVDIVEEARRAGIAVIMIEHILDAIVALSDQVVVLHYGKPIASGTAADVMSDPLVVEAYLGRGHAKRPPVRPVVDFGARHA